MDVEKTIEFLLNNQAGHDERLARIETTVDKLSVDVASLAVSVEALGGHVETLTVNVETLTGNVEALTGNVEALTTNMGALRANGATLHDSVKVLAVAVDKVTDSIVVVNRQSEARDKQLGERIDQLAIAIGEFVRNRPSAG